MARDTPLGFPAHTLPYRRGEFTTLSTASSRPAEPDGFLGIITGFRNGKEGCVRETQEGCPAPLKS